MTLCFALCSEEDRIIHYIQQTHDRNWYCLEIITPKILRAIDRNRRIEIVLLGLFLDDHPYFVEWVTKTRISSFRGVPPDLGVFRGASGNPKVNRICFATDQFDESFIQFAKFHPGRVCATPEHSKLARIHRIRMKTDGLIVILWSRLLDVDLIRAHIFPAITK